MKRIETLLGLAAVLATSGLAQAQGGPPGAPAAGTTATTQTTSETIVQSPLSGDSVSDDMAGGEMAAPSNLGQTGGEPLLMVIGGLALAGGALALRRKLA